MQDMFTNIRLGDCAKYGRATDGLLYEMLPEQVAAAHAARQQLVSGQGGIARGEDHGVNVNGTYSLRDKK